MISFSVEIEEKFWNRKMEERFGIILNNVELREGVDPPNHFIFPYTVNESCLKSLRFGILKKD